MRSGHGWRPSTHAKRPQEREEPACWGSGCRQSARGPKEPPPRLVSPKRSRRPFLRILPLFDSFSQTPQSSCEIQRCAHHIQKFQVKSPTKGVPYVSFTLAVIFAVCMPAEKLLFAL